MKKIHFLSSMPRSGSTLLCNLLSQNPRFHATQTSGCLDILFGVRNHWDTLVEHKAHPLPVARMNVLRGILYGYYDEFGHEVIFDKSRGWVAYLEMAEEILQRRAKVLVCVRSIPEILASLEMLHRNTARTSQPPGEGQNYFQFQTLAGRCEFWLGKENLVGIAYNRIFDAVQRGFRDRIHFVRFKNLTDRPKQTMQGIYEFLDEPWFEHDFDHVEQVTQEDDAVHGYVNLHTIRPKVERPDNDARAILGDELFERYNKLNMPTHFNQ